MNTVNEGGLYQLIFQSRKKQAKEFKHWVTCEVLPNIRKYGYYSHDTKKMDRAIVRHEKKTINKMLSTLSGQLSATDKRMISKQCRATIYELNDVLRGVRKDAYMLSLLFARATSNKILNKQFYTEQGAAQLIKVMQDETATFLN